MMDGILYGNSVVIERDSIAQTVKVSIARWVGSVVGFYKKAVKRVKRWNAIFGVIVKFCGSPVLLLISISNAMYKSISIALHEDKQRIISVIEKLDFENVQKLEEYMIALLNKMAFAKEQMEIINDIEATKEINGYIQSIISDATEIKKECRKQYTFSQKELFKTEEEAERYYNELKHLSDIWDYETPVEDKKFYYNLKKQIEQK